MKPALRPMETRWRACDRLPSKQAVARSHPEDWLLGFSFGGRSGPGVPRLPSRRLPRWIPPFGRLPPRSNLAASSWKAHCRLVLTVHEEEGSRVTRCAHTWCLGRAMGNHHASAWSAGVVPAPTRDRSGFQPFPVLCPGAPRCCTALLCYDCGVSMRPAAHSGPSSSLPCACRHGAGKIQGKVDVLVETTRIRKLSCCQGYCYW